jgi:hypothetical protein
LCTEKVVLTKDGVMHKGQKYREKKEMFTMSGVGDGIAVVLHYYYLGRCYTLTRHADIDTSKRKNEIVK